MNLGTPGTMCGVNGVYGIIMAMSRSERGLFDKQTFTTQWKPMSYHGDKAMIRATLRFDDECKNGKNSFAITGEIVQRLADGSPSRTDRGFIAGGCCHDEIAKAFPKLAHLIKWHLTDSDSPLYYIANTLYLAGNRDCHGLLAGEKKPIVGPDGKQTWELVALDENDNEVAFHTLKRKTVDGDTPPEYTPRLEWRLWCRTGEGKERQFDAARSTAVWPEATDEQLSLPRDELKALLEARHFDLMAAFKADIIGAGFMWTPRETVDA